MKQNYLQFDQRFYQPDKGIAMGSPISGLIAEIFLQHYEQDLIKNSLDSRIITFYNRYVDDIIIIHDQNRTNANDIQKCMNKIHKDLQFKVTEEKDNKISFLDLLINRENNSLSIDIYRKPTKTDMTIHCKSNYPTQHKIAAYRYMINRLHNLPLSQEQKHQEWNTILQIAQKMDTLPH
jgi:formyltetrahydrofolate hydrolase